MPPCGYHLGFASLLLGTRRQPESVMVYSSSLSDRDKLPQHARLVTIDLGIIPVPRQVRA